MVEVIVVCMVVFGIKNVGFIGFVDVYGESWLKDFIVVVMLCGIKIVDVECYVCVDISVMGQVVKLVSIKFDVIFVVGVGMGVVLLYIVLCECGYVGLIYQMYGVVMKDLICIGGKVVDGVILLVGLVIVVEQLFDSYFSKKIVFEYVMCYEKVNGFDMCMQFGVYMWDVLQVFQCIVLVVFKKVKLGMFEFCQVLKNVLELEYDIIVLYGVFNYMVMDYFGFDVCGCVLLIIDYGKWKLLN